MVSNTGMRYDKLEMVYEDRGGSLRISKLPPLPLIGQKLQQLH